MKCKTCGAKFDSDAARTFCSVKCRAADPDFRAILLRNLSQSNKRSGPERAGTVKPCITCGAEIYLTATAAKRGKKACSRACWRAWLALRFDRYIGAVASVAAMSGFDEYLTQEKIQCLIPDCAWEGHNLGAHCNLSHGITAAQLKEAAGFNQSTGLISGTLLRLYEEHTRKGNVSSLDREAAIASHPMKSQKRSREATEHHSKAMAIRTAINQAEDSFGEVRNMEQPVK